jgi:hypothetical protein
LPIIPPTAPHSSSSIIWGWYNSPVLASVIVALVPLHPKEGEGEELKVPPPKSLTLKMITMFAELVKNFQYPTCHIPLW